MTRVGVLGEALVDVLPAEGDLLVGRPGGSPANVAVALSRLGVEVAFLGRLSTDHWGQRLREHLAEEGVDVTAAPTGPEPTPIAFVDVGPGGQPTYRFLWEGTADRALRPADLPADLGVDALHVGSVSCVLPPGADAIVEVVAREHTRRLVSFDPNVRAALTPDADEARVRLNRLATMAHVVKASDEDLAFVFPGRDPEDAAWSLLDGETTRLVVLTRGGGGAEMLTPRDQIPIAPAAAGPVVDTVGAGDTFMAGLLAGLAEHDRLDVERIKQITADEARAVGRLAAAAAGVVVTRAGADPPRRAELGI
jgi:fructokinase